MYAMFGLAMPRHLFEWRLGSPRGHGTHLAVAPKQKPAVYDQRALVWRPYRTLASLHLWHSLKPDAVRFAE